MKRFRFAYLLASLALVVFLRPFIADRILGVAFVDILIFIAIIAGVFTTIDQRRHFMVIAALAIASAGSQIAWQLTGENAILVAFLTLTLVFYAHIMWFLIRSLFSGEQRITQDTLFQAVSVYLLFGLTWTFGYTLLELASPGSFIFGSHAPDDRLRYERFIGFSFTTLTTLGYGNISPATPRADALTSLQAVAGQIYLAIVIARLVAMQLTQGRNIHKESDL